MKHELDYMTADHKFLAADKKGWWGDGEWVDEFDEAHFSYRGFICHIERMAREEPYAKEFHMFGGYFCGYVEVPKEFKCKIEHLSCHFGITFNEVDEFKNHIVGFDCAHSCDIVPSSQKIQNLISKLKEQHIALLESLKRLGLESNILFQKTYRNIDFCMTECKGLVDQICGGATDDA